MYIQRKDSHFFKLGTFTCFIILTFSWIIAALLVNPAGNFPLNDDWSYGIAVERFVSEGVLEPTPWTSMSLVSQVWWGALFSSLFGFSFETLRLSTLVLSLLCIFGTFLLLRLLGQPNWLSLFTSLVIAFNPIYFALSFTFMTDIPFIAFSMLSVLFLLSYLRKESTIFLIMGSVLAGAAILCRQTGLFIPIAFGLTLLYKHRLKMDSLLPAVLPGLLGIGALLTYQFWLEKAGKTPELYGKQIHDLKDILLNPVVWPDILATNVFIALMYLGLFLLPVFVVLLLSPAESERNRWVKKWTKRAIVPLSALLGVAVMLAGKLMPLKGNILHPGGIGPLTLHDTYLLNLPNAASLPTAFWVGITILSVVGGALLLIYLVSLIRFLFLEMVHGRQDNRNYPLFFFLSGTMVYFFPILFLGYYDRYLIIPMILIALALFSFSGPIRLTVPKIAWSTFPVLAGLACFSIAATHDYLSWNRVRWFALQQLTEEGNIPYHTINGGFEYNGFLLFSDDLGRNAKDAWWSEEDDTYMISFGAVPGYKTITSYEYKQWLPVEKGKLHILRRKEL